MNKDKKPSQLRQLRQSWESSFKMRVMLFGLILVVLYGFIGMKIRSLGNAQPSQTTITAKASATTRPNIDQNVVDQIKQLQENNVNVQALFDQARQNPFRE